jgi:glycosyltransferase involved in cell wall biosynthesis
MRVLLLSRYGRLGASSRVRSYQYQPYLHASGIEVTAAPLLDDAYLEELYTGRARSFGRIFTAAIRRLRRLLDGQSYDLLWIEYELFPWMPALFERLLSRTGHRYVVEFDDAVFHRYDRHAVGLVRLALGRKIDTVMRRAAAVIVGNGYLAARAEAAGAIKIERLPSVIDLDQYPLATSAPAADDVFTIGWIGSPATAGYLDAIVPALRTICAESPARVRLVGAPEGLTWPGVNVEHRRWSEEREAKEIQACHVGIMPLPDGPWEQGKCGYKLVQYMACGAPVIASPVGVNRELVQHGVTGLLASSVDEWVEALRTLRGDAALRAVMGQRGRQVVEARYCVQVTAPRLVALFRELAA